MCIISLEYLDREKIRLLFDVLFVTVAFIDPEISPFYQSGSAPLVPGPHRKSHSELRILTGNSCLTRYYSK